MKRIFTFFLAAALCTGCMRGIPGDTPLEGIPMEEEFLADSGPVLTLTLELPVEANAPLALALADLARRYGADSGPAPGVRVLVRGGTGSEQDLLAQLLGESPAALYLLPADYVAGFCEGGLLRELSGEMEDAPAFLPAARAFCGEGGALFAAPYLGTVTALLYSPELLQKAGISAPPGTWRQLRENCRAVAAYTQVSGFAGVAYPSEDLTEVFTQLLTAFGGTFTGEGGAPPELTRALEFYRELMENGSTEESVMNDGNRAVQEFLLGRAAMVVGTPAHLALLEKNGFSAGAAPLPGEEQSGGARLHALAFALPAGVEDAQLQAASGFIRWLLEPQQLDEVLRAQYEGFPTGAQSTEREALLLPLTQEGAPTFFAQHPQYAAFTTELARAAPPAPGKKWEQFYANALLPTLRRVLMEEEAPAVAAAALAQKSAEILMN